MEKPLDLSKDSDVPCNGCTLCCYGMIALFPDLGDDMSLRKVEFLGGAGEFTDDITGRTLRFTHFLQTKPDGSCTYLGPKGCTIYDKRPTVCRSFDCGKLYRTLSRQQRRQGVRSGKFRQAVLDRGAEIEQQRNTKHDIKETIK